MTNTPAPRRALRTPAIRTQPPPRRHLLICEECRRSVLLYEHPLGKLFADQIDDLGWHEVGYDANHDIKRQWCPAHRHIGVQVFAEPVELGE